MQNDSLIRIICDAYMVLYKNKYGEQKLYTAIQKVMSSNKVTGLIATSRFHQVKPTAKNFTDAVISTTYFIFSRPDTRVLGSLLAVNRWNDEINQDQQLATQGCLKDIAFEILQNGKCYEFLAHLMSSLQTVEQMYQDDFTDDDIDDDIRHVDVPDFLDFEYEQKCAVVSSLLWIVQYKKDFSPEESKIYKDAKTLLELTKTDAANINEMTKKGVKYIANILHGLPANRKTWYVLFAHRILHADGPRPLDMKLKHFHTIMKAIGMTTEVYKRIAYEPQFPTGEVLRSFQDAETKACLDPILNGKTETQETPTKNHRFVRQGSIWYLDDSKLIDLGYSTSELSMSNGFCIILDTIAEGDNEVTLTIDSEPFKDADKLELSFKDEIGNHYYRIRTINGHQVNYNMCDDTLTDLVFGYIPDDIYLKRTF